MKRHENENIGSKFAICSAAAIVSGFSLVIFGWYGLVMLAEYVLNQDTISLGFALVGFLGWSTGVAVLYQLSYAFMRCSVVLYRRKNRVK